MISRGALSCQNHAMLPLFAVLVAPSFAPEITLRQGMTITKSSQIKAGTYSLSHPAEDWKTSAIKVSGNNIVVDFKGATLRGSTLETEPDQRKGLGVLVTGKNVTIKNLRVRGYKVGLLARNCPGLKLIDCDFSYNWKQRLMSTIEKEDLADWMSYHHNEKGEWLSYGAGAYLDGCEKFEVKGLRVTGGQCGLMLNRSNKGLVWNSDMSFNSALGLGMYRSSNNRIMHNKMDWCVRGYSHGVYNRGQDSSGILIFEQCSNNVFAYNSATHGGDGFFLWAGQHTMDTGQGGCNDNLLYGNDFSHSPCNAIEATFSRNKFVRNNLIDSWHGIWGGYSYDTLILGNTFGFNGEAIAIEHGQNNAIIGNTFGNDSVSVFLWQNSGKPDPNWGYPKHRDTRNVGTVVSRNKFGVDRESSLLLGTGTDITVDDNTFLHDKNAVKLEGEQTGTKIVGNRFYGPKFEAKGFDLLANSLAETKPMAAIPWMGRGGNSFAADEPKGVEYRRLFDDRGWHKNLDVPRLAKLNWSDPDKQNYREMVKHYVTPMKGGASAFIPPGSVRGRKYILVDEWGPYDFRRPLLWPRETTRAAISSINSEGQTSGREFEGRRFEVLGPRGKWKLVSKSNGVTIGQTEGSVPGMVEVSWPTDVRDISVVLEYVGGATVDYRGIGTVAGKPVKFGWSKSFFPIAWNVKFWAWDESRDPRTKYDAYLKAMESDPVATYKATELSFASGGSPYAGVPNDHFATDAEGDFEVDGGDYVLNVTSDDGVKVWLDGKLLIDEWHWQAPTQYSRDIKLPKGSHKLKILHFEIDGYTALKVEVKKK